jgi:tetraacyldisaccharide 4'-kinase
MECLWYPEPADSLGMKLLRAPLRVCSLGFGAGVAVRNALYDRGTLSAARAGARVLSVGNLNVGGAGKTQVVIWLANALGARGEQVAVLSRGYGRRSGEVLSFRGPNAPPAEVAGDEPVLLAQRCPQATVLVGGDRRILAAQAVSAGASVLVLDDGMQHRRLARDEEIVVVDEAVGLGNGALLPAGPLREPASALRRASLLWLRVTDGPAKVVPFAGPTVRARHAAVEVLGPGGERAPVEALRGQRVHLFSALARPASFRRAVEACGARIVGETTAPDHHRWQSDELAQALRAAQSEAAWLLTTEKDRVKLPPDAAVWVLRLGVEILSGAEHLERVLAGGARAG